MATPAEEVKAATDRAERAEAALAAMKGPALAAMKKKQEGIATATNVQACFMLTVLVVVLYFNHSSWAVTALLLLSAMVGSSMGWAFGVFLSPLDPDQEKYFTPVVKSVTTFVGGYLISYLNKFVDALFFHDEVLHPTRLIGAGIFVTSLIVTWITVFTNRFMFDRPIPAEASGKTPP